VFCFVALRQWWKKSSSWSSSLFISPDQREVKGIENWNGPILKSWVRVIAALIYAQAVQGLLDKYLITGHTRPIPVHLSCLFFLFLSTLNHIVLFPRPPHKTNFLMQISEYKQTIRKGLWAEYIVTTLELVPSLVYIYFATILFTIFFSLWNYFSPLLQ
jgi:hypothetical protein